MAWIILPLIAYVILRHGGGAAAWVLLPIVGIGIVDGSLSLGVFSIE